ncbi:MAG: dethiobiotin synthase [Gammaproteobacteria bacterium]
MRGVFVTGTDTGVGKTLVAAGLLRAFARSGWPCVGMKPVASGAAMTAAGPRNADALALQRAASLPRPYEWVNPYVFVSPVAPHIAAAETGVSIGLVRILESYTRLCQGADAVVVEGVGGWQVPLSDSLDMPDLARQLALPVILVVGLRLGCLNHALLSARAIRADGLKLGGWVANAIDAGFQRHGENLTTLRRTLGAPLLGEIPHQSGQTAEAVATWLDVAAMPGFLTAS